MKTTKEKTPTELIMELDDLHFLALVAAENTAQFVAHACFLAGKRSETALLTMACNNGSDADDLKISSRLCRLLLKASAP